MNFKLSKKQSLIRTIWHMYMSWRLQNESIKQSNSFKKLVTSSNLATGAQFPTLKVTVLPASQPKQMSHHKSIDGSLQKMSCHNWRTEGLSDPERQSKPHNYGPSLVDSSTKKRGRLCNDKILFRKGYRAVALVSQHDQHCMLEISTDWGKRCLHNRKTRWLHRAGGCVRQGRARKRSEVLFDRIVVIATKL